MLNIDVIIIFSTLENNVLKMDTKKAKVFIRKAG